MDVLKEYAEKRPLEMPPLHSIGLPFGLCLKFGGRCTSYSSTGKVPPKPLICYANVNPKTWGLSALS